MAIITTIGYERDAIAKGWQLGVQENGTILSRHESRESTRVFHRGERYRYDATLARAIPIEAACAHYDYASPEAAYTIFPNCLPDCYAQGAAWVETSYQGAVLTTYERNMHDDSDFYAIVWTGTALKHIEVNSTRYAGGGHAVVDATSINRAAAMVYHRSILIKQAEERAAAQARTLTKGKAVRVIQDLRKGRGRNAKVILAKDTVGTIEWVGKVADRFVPNVVELVKLRLADGSEIWTPLVNGRQDAETIYGPIYEVINPQEYLPAYESVLAQAEAYVGHWRSY